MTPEEILSLALSNQDTLGMTDEEKRRRQVLIEAVLKHHPDVAEDIAKGPYRMNGGQPAGGPSVTPGDYWRGGTRGGDGSNNQSLADSVRGKPQQSPQFPTIMGMAAQGGPFPSASYNAPPPSTTGPMVSNQPSVQGGPGFAQQPSPNYTFPQFDGSVQQGQAPRNFNSPPMQSITGGMSTETQALPPQYSMGGPMTQALGPGGQPYTPPYQQPPQYSGIYQQPLGSFPMQGQGNQPTPFQMGQPVPFTIPPFQQAPLRPGDPTVPYNQTNQYWGFNR